MVEKTRTMLARRARMLWAYSRAHKRGVILAVFFVFLGVVLTLFILKTALSVSINPVKKHTVSSPLILQLNQSIAKIDTANITLSPKLDGTWKHEKSTLPGNDTLVFTPTTYFSTSTRYDISFPKVERLLIGTPVIEPYSFTTEDAPSLTKSGSMNLGNGAVIPADYQPTVSLSSPNRTMRDVILRTSPELAFIRSFKNDTTYSWKTEGFLPQGVPLSMEFYDKKNNVVLAKKIVTVATEPRLTAPLDRTYINNGDAISLTFSEPIERSSADISFSVPGNGSWKNETEYIFTPTSLQPGTKHTYTVKAGLRTKAGGILTAEQNGTLTTTGAVLLAQTSPSGSGASAVSQRLAITFDQSVDKRSAETRLSASSGTLEQLSWQGTTLLAVLKNAGYQKTVTISLEAGIVNAGFGLPSATRQSFSFDTEIRTVRMAVPHFRQVFKASCTAASLRMALAYRGITSDDMSLITQMGYTPRSKDTSTDPASWDDPSEMFVGSVDGTISGGTGAGPDAPPVAKAARAFGRNADAVTGIDAYWIARQIHAGNPVVMFGAQKNTGMTSWVTPSGRLTTMNLTGHATTVLGVVGEADAPLGFWVSDPLAYGPQYWTLAAVANNIARDPYRQAVVIY